MRQGTVPSLWLALTLTGAALLPFACNKAEPAPEAAPSTAVEPVASVEPARVEATVEPAATEAAAPSASAALDSSAAASAAAAPSADKPKPTTGERPPTATPPTPAPPAGYTGPDPCRATSFKFASVRSACTQGGVKQAKSLMKGMVKRAKDDGKDIKCSSCHEDTKTYTLKPNAVDDMRPLQ